jgi:hypothetical protein
MFCFSENWIGPLASITSVPQHYMHVCWVCRRLSGGNLAGRHGLGLRGGIISASWCGHGLLLYISADELRYDPLLNQGTHCYGASAVTGS